MNLLVTCRSASFAVRMETGETLALYEVPREYSEDGLYLATWGPGEYEPIPAGEWSAPLLRLRLMPPEDGGLQEIRKGEGVSYAEN